jgi:Flp pilus assembly protein TadG
MGSWSHRVARVNGMMEKPIHGREYRRSLPRRILKHWATRGERGSALVEFALCTMLFMVLMFGIIEFGLVIFSYNFVSHGAREGTRYAMVRGSSCSGLANCPATSAEIQSYVTSRAPSAINQSALTVTATCGAFRQHASPVIECNSSINGVPNDSPGNVVQVKVQYNFSFMFGFVSTSSIAMTSTSQRVIAQ